MKAKPATIVLMVASLVSGCSLLPSGSAQYMSLPTAGIDVDTIPITRANRSDFTASQTGFSRSAATATSWQPRDGIDPLAILQTRASIQPVALRSERTKLAHAATFTDPSTTATVNDGRSIGIGSAPSDVQSYDRAALMERLFAQGKKAVLPICEGC